jgi:hypothetical protein
MTRYKLRPFEQGDELRNDDGTIGIVADTIDVARDCFRDHTEDGEPPIYLHSLIGRLRIVYKRDVDNGDCHEDAEPGDTTIDGCARDDGRELRPDEVRWWELGGPQWHWEFAYSPGPPIPWREVPVGCRVYHPVLGSGEIVYPPRKGAYGLRFPVRFGWPKLAGPVRWMPLGAIHLRGTATWPGDRRLVTVTVEGEVVASGVSERTAEQLRDLRCARLTAEWEAEQFAAFESAGTPA